MNTKIEQLCFISVVQHADQLIEESGRQKPDIPIRRFPHVFHTDLHSSERKSGLPASDVSAAWGHRSITQHPQYANQRRSYKLYLLERGIIYSNRIQKLDESKIRNLAVAMENVMQLILFLLQY